MLKKFGNTVRLEILGPDRKVIFDTTGLRVDFQIKIIPGMNRAKFSIYNLNNETIKSISNGTRYVRLYVSLHDGPVQTTSYDFLVNNAMSIKRVPEGVTELYCVDSAKKYFLDKQVTMRVSNPTLENVCRTLLKKGDYKGRFKFIDFPKHILKFKPTKPVLTHSGSIEGMLKKMGKSYGFNTYVEGNVISLIYKPLASNVRESGLLSRNPYILDTSNMRSNPKIGVKTLHIESNLDLEIKAGTVLDTQKLITAETSLGFDDLTIVRDYLKNSVDGDSRYQTLTVEHKGSNYTKEWSTSAMAVRATKGTHTPTYGWYS